jgi:hypothetical protein
MRRLPTRAGRLGLLELSEWLGAGVVGIHGDIGERN